jgi:7-dehydrocholesterol reductase
MRVEHRLEGWLTGLPVGGPRPAPPNLTRSDATLLRGWVAPLALMVVTPCASIAFYIACAHYQGSLGAMLHAEPREWLAHFPLPSVTALAIVLGWVAFQAILLQLLPGRTSLGPLTPAGVQPTYRLNGVAAWVITHVVVVGGWWLGLLDVGALYRHYGAVLATLNLIALPFCAFLYWKGRRYPSSPDAVVTGNPLLDFFQGVELHPRLFGVNVKQLVNCRVSMMGWSVVFVSFAITQYEQHGSLSSSMAASALVLVAYLFKFFLWEEGYFRSLDIMHDRFGYYIAWGVLVWVPAVYCLPALWLVGHPIEWPPALVVLMVALGALGIAINYLADAQRQRVRATGGATTVWGRPPKLIAARYTTGDGVEHESVLLASGWWRVARHFHYVPELLAATAWTLPAGFTHLLPWVYALFLLVLLVDRAGRDEKRCAAKYGRYWTEYTALVRWKMLPGIY